MSSRCPYRASSVAADFAPNPGKPGKPSALSPTRASQSGIDSAGDAELRDHSVGVDQLVLTAVQLDDLAADALPEVLVGRADDHLLDPWVGRGDHGCAGQAVVRLDVHHRPDRDAECPQRVLQPVELRQQQRVHASARLVRRPHVVAERLDDVVGRDPDMGRAVLQHREHRLDDAAGRADLDAVAVQMSGPRRVVLPEDLVGPVDEMNDHAPSLAQRT